MSSGVFFKGLLKTLLLPFAVLYGLIVRSIQFLHNSGLYKKTRTPMFSIGIGNITVGGTGKTPHVEFLISKYKERFKIATLSRGYGRNTKGFIPVTKKLGPNAVGDEPWQFFLKFGDNVKVNVGEKRVAASQKIHTLYPDVDLLLMDDVFQHHAVQADFSILLCDYTNPFFKDYPFPAGRLREFRSGAKRADAIIVSKCPANLLDSEKAYFVTSLSKYAPAVPVFFSTYHYGSYIPVFETTANVPSKWLLVTGIANPKPLENHLREVNAFEGHLEFADHHAFTDKELSLVVSTFHALKAQDKGVLLTEKDYARLSNNAKSILSALPVYYVPIEVKFLGNENELLQKIDIAMHARTTFQNK
jgi:tetraacyldisaccharide 4'-kinase